MTDVRLIPKAELHCHSDGVLDPGMLRELLQAGHDPGITPEALAARYPFDSVDHWISNYGEYIEPHLAPAAEWVPLTLECHVRRLKAQHLRTVPRYGIGRRDPRR